MCIMYIIYFVNIKLSLGNIILQEYIQAFRVLNKNCLKTYNENKSPVVKHVFKYILHTHTHKYILNIRIT